MKSLKCLFLGMFVLLPLVGCGGNQNPNPPTPSDITVAQAINEAKGLEKGATSTNTYSIIGLVSNSFEPKESTQTAKTYNFNMVDSQSDAEQLVCWWVSGEFGLPVKDTSITVSGKLQRYVDSKGNEKYEVVEGKITHQSDEPGPGPIPSDTITVTKALEEARKLEKGQKSASEYKIAGYVSNAFDPKQSTKDPTQYNFNIVDTQGGEQLICWWLKDSFGLPTKGSEIIVKGYLQNYDGKKMEVVDGSVVSQGGGGGGDTYDAKTVANDVGKALGLTLEYSSEDEAYEAFDDSTKYTSSQCVKALQDIVKKLPTYLKVVEAPAIDTDEYGEYGYTVYSTEDSSVFFEAFSYYEESTMWFEYYVY